MSGLLVYLVYLFICQCILSLDSMIVSGLLVYLVYRFIVPCILSQDSGIGTGLFPSVQSILKGNLGHFFLKKKEDNVNYRVSFLTGPPLKAGK